MPLAGCARSASIVVESAPGSTAPPRLRSARDYDARMSIWYSVEIPPKVGSLAAVASALAAAGVAVEGIVGSPEGDGTLHIGVPDDQAATATSALTALGLRPIGEGSRADATGSAPLDSGIIGAILRGPRD